MEESTKNKNIFYMVVLIMTLITFVLGVAFALYEAVASQKNEGTKLYTGKLEINYIDGNVINNPILWPMSEPSYTATEYVYKNNFSVVSRSTLDQTITVSLIVNINEFSEGVLKYAVYNNKGDKLSSGDVPKSGSIKILDNLFLAYNGTANYTLIMWMSNENYNQNEELGKKISGTISVLAEQLRY